MALSLILGEAQLKAEHMETKAEVTLDKESGALQIAEAPRVLAAFWWPHRRRTIAPLHSITSSVRAKIESGS